MSGEWTILPSLIYVMYVIINILNPKGNRIMKYNECQMKNERLNTGTCN